MIMMVRMLMVMLTRRMFYDEIISSKNGCIISLLGNLCGNVKFKRMKVHVALLVRPLDITLLIKILYTQL